MKFELIAEHVQGLRWVSQSQGRILYDHVIKHKAQNILELGFYHGVSAMYMAAAMSANGVKGKLTTIDKEIAADLSPNIHQLIDRVNLDIDIKPIFAESCYTWELMKLLEQTPRPAYDLIFIDGGHVWKTDGFAFFLCEKMLKPGGWVIFDDLDWTISSNSESGNNSWTDRYSEEEKNTRQIRKIFELLVKEHPNYDLFHEEEGFGFARKAHSDKIVDVKESTKIKQVVVTKEMLQQMMQKK